MINIIESQGLKAEGSGGSSHPVAIARVGNRKQSTRVMPNCTSCVWDDTFFFPLNDQRRSDLLDTIVSVRVEHSGSLGNKLIGSCEFDLPFIW